MPLNEQQRETIIAFREFVEDSVSADARYGVASRHDREDGSVLAVRFAAAPRWKSEEAEQAIEDSGDTMSEFVEAGFDEAGLDWPDPPVEHFREGGEYFYFATSLNLDETGDLNLDATRDKVLRMLEGYLIAFGPAVVVDEEE
ncbi:MAG: hypothetical protein HY763_17050 [Planctomycetes bacterium]|nr:hypothetical protein [Planctomycetota bacterium]